MTAFAPFQSDHGISVLGPTAFDELQAFLTRDPRCNIFMLSWLQKYGVRSPLKPHLFRYLGYHEAGRLTAAALIVNDRLLLLSAADTIGAKALGAALEAQALKLDHIVSHRKTVDAFWDVYQTCPGVHLRLRRDQELLSLERANFFHLGEPAKPAFYGDVRFATPADIDGVFLASAQMHAEETLKNPLDTDAVAFRRHVAHRIDHHRTLVWYSERRLIFKADLSAHGSVGAQISGVFTPPQLRGQGIATYAMWALAKLLFEQGYPRLVLYVNDDNQSARHVYAKTGFSRHCDYRTIFLED